MCLPATYCDIHEITGLMHRKNTSDQFVFFKQISPHCIVPPCYKSLPPTEKTAPPPARDSFTTITSTALGDIFSKSC